MHSNENPALGSSFGGEGNIDPWDLKWSKYCAFGAGVLQILATILFFIRDAAGQNSDKSNQEKWKLWTELNPSFLIEEYDNQMNIKFLTDVAILVASFAWLLTIPPILGLAEIYGSKRSLSQLMVVGFLASAGLTVLNLIFDAGTDHATAYLASQVVNATFEETQFQTHPNQLFRVQVIAMASFIVRSRELWLFACVSLFQSVGFFVASVQAYRTGKLNRWWAHLGMCLAFLGVIHFLADLGRDVAWVGFSYTAFFITIIQYIIGFPLWIVWMGCEFRTFDLDEMTSILNSQPVGNDGL